MADSTGIGGWDQRRELIDRLIELLCLFSKEEQEVRSEINILIDVDVLVYTVSRWLEDEPLATTSTVLI